MHLPQSQFILCLICIAIPPTLCEAVSEGLVRYPNWIAPLIGSETVSTQCADNAHRTSTGLNVTCTSDGIWSGPIPVCECDDGHHVSTADDGRDICRGDNLMFTKISQGTASGGAFLLLLTLITITILAVCLLRVSITRPKRSKSYDQLWVRTGNNSGGFPTSSAFGMSNIMGTREDDEDEEDCSPSSQPPNKSLETRIASTSRQVENMEGIVFPSLTFVTTKHVEEEEEDRKDGGCLPGQVSLGVETEVPRCGECLGDATSQNTVESAESSEYCEEEVEEEESENEEVGTVSLQTVPIPRQDNLGHIEEIYDEVLSHGPRKKVDKRSDPKSENDDTMTQPPQQSAAVDATVPESGEYDDIVLSDRRIKKPRNVEEVEEIYDVVVNQLATRKDSTSTLISRVKAYAVVTVPAPYELPVPTNEAYALSENVPVSTNEAYALSENVPVSTNEAYATNENVPVSTNSAYKTCEGVKGEGHAYDSVN
jgi:hypothetical protein